MSDPTLSDLFSQRPGLETDDVTVSPDLFQEPVVAPESQTAFQLDQWGLGRGEALCDAWKEQEAGDFDPLIIADAHGALFEKRPQLAERPANNEIRERSEWFKMLMETNEYRDLHKQTRHDSLLSGFASVGVCQQWVEYVKENPPPPPNKDGTPGPAPGSDGEPIEKTINRINSVGNALEQAKKDVSDAKDTMAGLGMGEPGSPLDPAKLAEAFKKIRESDFLRDVMRMAGRMRSRCASLQKQKIHAVRGEITGIELGGDVGRLLPYEMLQVAGAIPELETLALYRLAQRRMLCYKHKVNTPVKSGPIVLVRDESGSMGGQKMIDASAIALTMVWLATQQKRWVALVGFSGGTEGHWLCLPPGRVDQEKLFEWLVHDYGGGTDLDVPLKELPFVYWPRFCELGLQRGKTDVILITDAIVNCPDKMRDAYLAWAKAEEVRTFGIIIGEDDPGDLAQVCNRCFCVDDLSLDSAAVEQVLSI